jgi:hypothetical protein
MVKTELHLFLTVKGKVLKALKFFHTAECPCQNELGWEHGFYTDEYATMTEAVARQNNWW